MQKIWAPWRIKYIKNKKKKGCIFCQSAKSNKFLIIKTKHSIAILNIFPYNNGHMLVAPLRHIRDLSQLDNEEIIDLINTLNRTKSLLDKTLRPDGYNIGINISKSAGAGIPGHLHIHIVPRWKGDTNFMPIIFNTKVISQSLQELYMILKNAHTKRN